MSTTTRTTGRTAAPTAADTRPAVGAGPGVGAAVAVAAAAVLVAGCAGTGWWLAHHGYHLHMGTTYPVAGRYRLHLTAWLAVPVGVAAAVLRYGYPLARRLPWSRLLALSYLTALAWATALALAGGLSALTAPLAVPAEYPHDVGRVGDVGTFLSTFTRYVAHSRYGPQWTTHVAGHPPLATLMFVLLDRAGLGGLGWAAALCVLAGAATVPAVLSTIRVLAGEPVVRVAAPFVATAPLALWIATSADAVFAAVAAAGVCALAHAAAGTGPRRAPLAVLGGLLLGTCLFLSYGLVLIAPVALAAVLVAGRAGGRPGDGPGPGAGPAGRAGAQVRVLLVAGVAVAVVVAAVAAAGFWWPDGFAVATRRVAEGVAHRDRPWLYFLFANPAAVAVSVGPAVIAALPLCTRLRPWLTVPAAALGALAVATLTGLSKGEVERIYLPWTVWLASLPALLPGPYRTRWLAAQLGWALTVAATTTLSW